MSKRRNTPWALPQTDEPSTGFVVGRTAFETISAIEGIVPSAASRERAEMFDQRGLSAEERRRAIIAAHRPKP